MKFVAVASLALAGVVAAQNATMSATGCLGKLRTCQSTGSDGSDAPNESYCSSQNEVCIGACYATYNTCRTSAGANFAECVSNYATCLGQNPVSPTGGITILPLTASATSSSAAASATASGDCKSQENACRTAPGANQSLCSSNLATCQGKCYAALGVCQTTPVDGLSANQAQCVANYAQCLGENPVASTGGFISSFLPYTATANATATGGVSYTTEVVTAYTTVCPAPTAGPYTTQLGPVVYTISSETTITVTNCPCTLTKPVPSTAAASTTKSGAASTTSGPAVFTGAAAQFGAGMGLLGAAAGAVMLL